LASRGSIDRVWYTTKYEEGFLDKEARTVMFGKELIDIFKQLRGSLVRCFNSKSYYLRLRQNMRIDVETVNNMDLVRVSIIGTEIYYEAWFEDGVKQNMQDLFRMVDRIPEYCPAPPPYDRNSQLMFEYFKKKEYRNLEGLKGGDLFKKVFFILSHPIFFDLEDITRFTYTCHRLYIRNADRFVADIQLDGELSIRGWAEYICDNNGQSLHNVLVHCLRYKGPGVYHDPFSPIYREPYSVVIFMRNLLRHSSGEASVSAVVSPDTPKKNMHKKS